MSPTTDKHSKNYDKFQMYPLLKFFQKDSYRILLIPIIAYGIYYSYEYMYNRTLHLPFDIVEFDFTKYGFVLAKIMAFILLYYLIHMGIFESLQENNTTIAFRLRRNTNWIAILIFVLVVLFQKLEFSDFNSSELRKLLIIPTFLLLLLIISLFRPTLPPSVTGQPTRNPFKVKVETFRGELVKSWDYSYFYTAIYFALINLIFLLPIFNATFQSRYLVLNNDTDKYVVLQDYNDKLICVKYDIKANRAANKIYFFPKAQGDKFYFTKEKIGFIKFENGEYRFKSSPFDRTPSDTK